MNTTDPNFQSLPEHLQDALKIALLKSDPTGSALQAMQSTGILPTPCDSALNKFITVDEDMIELKNRVRKIWDRPEPVLIQGESGTGKELIARALHGNRSGAFVSINMTSLPDTLIESELFGHIKGSFTGALETKVGLFEEANNGTLFLDEIGDMPANAQAKLLRVLQERRIRRVGDNKEINITCRIICATHRDIKTMIAEKMFRLDLYWRLNTIVLQTKPLRERVNDIREIIDAKFDKESKIPEEILEKFERMELLGNIRELESRVLKYKLFGEI